MLAPLERFILTEPKGAACVCVPAAVSGQLETQQFELFSNCFIA